MPERRNCEDSDCSGHRMILSMAILPILQTGVR